jgi:hypothetical protein
MSPHSIREIQMTPTVVAESRHPSAFIAYEGSGWFSRETLAVAPNQTLVAGQVVGKVRREAGADEVVALNLGGTDGSQIAAGILIYPIITDGSTTKVAVLVRHCEVRASHLTWPVGITVAQKAAAVEQLRAAGIQVS